MATGPQTPFSADRLDAEAFVTRWRAATRKAGHAFLDLFERSVNQVTDAQVKTARAADLPEVVTIAEKQAKFSRDCAGVYVRAARKYLDR
jgi:hypothetical protein